MGVLTDKENVNKAMAIHAFAPSHNPRVDEFLNYMINTWISETSLFSRQVWKQLENLSENSIRTNNHLESFHSAFRKGFRTPHPNIFVLISELKKKAKSKWDQHVIVGPWCYPTTQEKKECNKRSNNQQIKRTMHVWKQRVDLIFESYETVWYC